MRRAPLLAVVALLVLAGCGDGDTTTAPPAVTGTPTATAEDTPAATATPEPKRGLRLDRIGSFDSPVFVTSPPEDPDRLYVVEQGGVIRLVGENEPFLDISGQVTVGSEQGLLSMAFAPDYAQSDRFYVYFTDEAGNQRVVEYQAESPSRADPDTARIVLEMADEESNHNGGLLLFGPDDLLYIGTGDGGGGGDLHGTIGNGQDLGTLLGKILRIDPRGNGEGGYTVPGDNPFAGRSGAREEIYSYGLRNPWRFSFDRETGDLTIGDVGQNAIEEIDFVRAQDGAGAGANFGWRPFEGNDVYTPGEDAPGHVPPVITQSHGDGNCSITGGVVVRDERVPGALGRYLFGDYCKGEVYSAALDTPEARGLKPTGLTVENLASFGEDADGRVYLVSTSGPVYRLVAGNE